MAENRSSQREMDRMRYIILPRLKENSAKTCAEVMTSNPVCCLADDMITKAIELMRSENIGSVPVIENWQTKKLVGIVTDRDLTLQIVGSGNNPKNTPVQAIMTHKLVTCRASDDAQKALDTMARHQLRRIPVVDQDNRMVGMIAKADVAARVNQPEKTANLVKEISQSGAK